MQNKVTSAFQAHFQRPPEVVVRAPGRVNLLGGHTDYNAGYVLPVAVDRAAWVAAAPIGAREARVHALDLEDKAVFSLTPVPRAEGNWADYVRGVAWALQERGLETAGLEAVLTSSIPVGAGLSSSAAIEVAFAHTWQRFAGFELTRRELALTCQRAENDYVGVNCGILDQMASSCGVEGRALLLDCRTLETNLVPLPAGVAIVVADTGARRRLASSEYNVRRAQCERAVKILSERLPGVRALRDVSAGDLERLKGHLPEVVYRRARHIVSDNARVLRAAEALREGDVATVGALMKACHVSLRDDYEVSAPELDVLAEAAWEMESCYGARLTGAGFGGCIVALVAADGAPDFEVHVSAAYEAVFDRQPDIYICRSTTGVRAIPHA
ncbi:MAG TPA: galactokinase [Thermoflexia bacterium]|nr:galactokinase [Thermoflexia bacterium]